MFFFLILYICCYCFFFYNLVFKFDFKKGDVFSNYGRINKLVLYETNIYTYIYILYNIIVHLFFFFAHITKFYNYFFFIKLFASLNLVVCLMIMLFFESFLAYCYHSYELNKQYNISLISWNGFFYFIKVVLIVMINQSLVLFFVYTFILISLFGLLHNNRNYVYNIPKNKI